MLFLAEAPATFGENVKNLCDEILATMSEHGLAWGFKVLAALAIFFIGRWIAGILARVLSRGLERGKVDMTLNKFLTRLAYILMTLAVVIAALDRLGVQTTSLVAIIGAAGLAIGLALQSSLSNFAAGVMIIIFRPFQVGDSIEAGSVSGTVEEISIFTTHLRTADNRLIIVPNSTFTTQAITNASVKPTRRIDLVIGISYNDNIKTAKAIIQRVLDAEPRILPDPLPTIGVANLGESSVDIVVRPWVKAADYWPTRFHLIETIKVELEAGGCSIPYPQRDVHVFQSAEKK